ncbi:MAG: DUF4125 family protein [Bacteroides sp.]|nr:DUF4125 family protein [Bacteroides sp.]MCM1549616.1 DUF4125 family protein [Clostridium sp.]
MNVDKFFSGLDDLFSKGDMEAVEPYFQEQQRQAEQEGDLGAQITILNERMGFYRETSQYENAKQCIQQVMELIEQAGLTDSLPHATTLLNSANALRAAGELEQAMEYYNRVFALFEGQVPQMDFRYAELYNNVSLLYQELGRYDMASQCLLHALAIVQEQPGKEFQLAVTLTNLGSSQLQEGKIEAAISHLSHAITLFKSMQVSDTHMAAALSAMGEACFRQKEFSQAEMYYQQALEMIEAYIGRTDAYKRVKASLEAVRQQRRMEAEGKTAAADRRSGLELSLQFYKEYGADMIHQQFADYEARIAVGFAGEGSDRFGFDDIWSEDHDFGVGFSMWVSDEDYEAIGKELQQAYEELVKKHDKEQQHMIWTIHSQGRFGVRRMHDFYEQLTGYPEGPVTREEWMEAGEERLAAATNGMVFRDDFGEFSRIRNQIKRYYPMDIWLLKVAQYTSLFGQYGQYNYQRMAKRQAWTAAAMMREKAVEYALHSVYLINRHFCPHDKWLQRGIEGFEFCEGVGTLCEQMIFTDIRNINETCAYMERIAALLLEGMVQQGMVYPRKKGDVLYLETYGNALAQKAEWVRLTVEELAERIAKMEFEAFDNVKNEGGRADCQDDWHTFRIMRVSQYLTWTKEMLLQYGMDFQGAYADGWNMITEKYGRMMESTAPDAYGELEPDLPPVSQEKRSIVEEIVKIQVAWMEAFQNRYPKLTANARVIHTSEDTPWTTSYETYLRGELLTYTDTMLVMYGRFVAQLMKDGKNLAEMILKNTTLLYGYEGLEAAEQALS